jgi:putative phosphoesterase
MLDVDCPSIRAVSKQEHFRILNLQKIPYFVRMKKIGLLSDTHSVLDPKVFEYFKEVDEVWHAGDIGDMEVIKKLEAFKPLRAVYGNIDNGELRAEFPLDLRFDCEGMDVWITHIGGYPGKYNKRVREILAVNPPDLFICGHSHILKVMPDKKHDLLHINPGACGIHGFHKVKTIIRFSVEKCKITGLEVIELGARGLVPT